MELRNRHVGKPKEETDTATDTATSASSSCESTSEASSVDVCRRWPPMVTEAPSWPVGGDKTTSAGEGDVGRCADEQTDSSWRLFHWGPMIAIFIVAYISAVTTYFTLLWWPLSSVGGLVHYAIFLLWNGLTLANHMKASAWGAGYVPLKWRPPKKEHESQLQWCAVCEGFKAPRSHHCSKCKRCCMKMDHHCPWINNCVGHRNHSVFVRFLFFAIVGCIHAFIIHCICFYHAVNMAWYIRFGNGSDPLIHLSLWTLLSLVVASAFAVGVALGLTMLLVIQIKYLWKNQTGIEQYIDQKAVNRRQEEDDLDAWIYPYNLGWRRNLKEVICSWTGIPRGNGIWWPVVEDCNQFTITLEQLHQKELKRGFAKLVEITEMNHVDVDQLLEDYAWHHFKDIQSLRKTRLDDFKNLERDDCEFVLNRKNLVCVNEDPVYSEFQPVGAKPYTLFKSIFTNNTNRPQEYSFKTERTTESLCAVAREQGYMIGAEAELTLKTPCEIAELKAGFKHEMHFNNLNENVQTETLTWGVDSNVQVPPNYSTEASIMIEEMNYRGSYSVACKLTGNVTISIRRRRDNVLILPIKVAIVEVFRAHLDSPLCKKEVKQVVSIDQNRSVRLLSKGSCQFQFAMKQRIDLKERAITGRDVMID